MSTLAPPALLPRLIAGIGPDGPARVDQHLATHGPLPHLARSRSGLSHDLIDELERAGLTGRGGAAFPTAAKLRAVMWAGDRTIVVGNGCEGEPTSLKDRLLLERAPHLVLDGAALAAECVRAREIVIAVDERAASAARALDRAVRERRDLSRGRPRVRIARVPSGYVSGQESALVNFLGGGPAKPSTVPPMVFERGLKGRPTLVNNLETLAQIALIARHGADWFRELGTDEEPGSRLVTVSGAIAEPGVYEIEQGASLESLLDAAGGAAEPLRAFLLGGYAGAWLPAELGAKVALSNTDLAAFGASLGAGIVVAIPASACVVAEVASVSAWLAGQSAGQCGPCVNGLQAIATALGDVGRGTAGPAVLERVTRWASLVQRRGACGHPDGAARFVTSALRVFAAEFADHAHRGPCASCNQPRWLPLTSSEALAAAA
jgi:NADH:ubiquinone oxidoreductase subunit F (NADH-binding)